MIRTMRAPSVLAPLTIVVGLALAAESAPQPVSKPFAVRFADTARALGSKPPCPRTQRRLVQELADAAKTGDLVFLARKQKEVPKTGAPSEAKLASLVLARLAGEHQEAMDALLASAKKYQTHALAALAYMEPDAARSVGAALLDSKLLPEVNGVGAEILAIVGREPELRLMQQAIDKKPSGLVAPVLRSAQAAIKHRLGTAEKGKLEYWERSGLEYWHKRFTIDAGGSMAPAYSIWRAGKAVVARGEGRLPGKLLKYKVVRHDLLAIAIAGHQGATELLPELERIARGSGDASRLARLSLSHLGALGSEKAVNACLRVTGTHREDAFRHLQLAKFAAEHGGATTLEMLRTLAKDDRLPQKVRKLYDDAADRLQQRLARPATKPMTYLTPGLRHPRSGCSS